MAGHSHWANIQRSKGANDKARGKLFGKLSRLIIVAARNGGADPDMNLRLRYAIDKAKAVSMPKDNIERAVKKGAGELNDGETFDEVLYEGYAPGGTAVLCEILTDNRNRTAGEIRKAFDRFGGSLGTTGCVSYLFDTKGVFTIPASATDEEALFEIVLEAGAEDVKREGSGDEAVFEVLCDPRDFDAVAGALNDAGVEPGERGGDPRAAELRRPRRRHRGAGAPADGGVGGPRRRAERVGELQPAGRLRPRGVAAARPRAPSASERAAR